MLQLCRDRACSSLCGSQLPAAFPCHLHLHLLSFGISKTAPHSKADSLKSSEKDAHSAANKHWGSGSTWGWGGACCLFRMLRCSWAAGHLLCWVSPAEEPSRALPQSPCSLHGKHGKGCIQGEANVTRRQEHQLLSSHQLCLQVFYAFPLFTVAGHPPASGYERAEALQSIKRISRPDMQQPLHEDSTFHFHVLTAGC